MSLVAVPPGSQGPGRIAGAVVRAMELSLARRASDHLPLLADLALPGGDA